MVNCLLQILLFIICLYMIRHEPTRKNKFIFLNFSLFFSVSILFHIYNFVGTIFFKAEPFARFYVSQYIGFALYYFLLTFGIVYLAIDAIFGDSKLAHKYFLALSIVGTFFVFYYSPIISDPKFLYNTEDILDWKELSKSYDSYQEKTGIVPGPLLLAQMTEIVNRQVEQSEKAISTEAKLARVNDLYPYLAGSNYKILLYRPLYMNTIYMCVMSLGFILLFFGYQYVKDPPQGAYIEKIMFLFLIFCSLEILHSWSFIKAVEWQSFVRIFSIGEYFSLGVISLMVFAFWARLRFISSPKGEYYEQEIASSPQSVTRWRDGIDNIIIDSFFNRKAILGRMFVDPSTKEAKT
jgi:hypothetical protein